MSVLLIATIAVIFIYKHSVLTGENFHEELAISDEATTSSPNNSKGIMTKNIQTLKPEGFNIMELEVDSFFSHIDGAFMLRDLSHGHTFIFNHELANQMMPPQSTFKIPHSLIGLQIGAVENVYSLKHWDGVYRGIDSWNQNHTLTSAFKHSAVWYYQALARDIGEQHMQEWLTRISYGNQDISGGIDSFWLSSSLLISPLDQVNFLEALYKHELPFDKDVMESVKEIMLQIQEEHFTLYGKTGQGSGLGWFIGYLETKDNQYVFATNVKSTSAEAREVTLDILKRYNLMY